jgi:adenylate cyclase
VPRPSTRDDLAGAIARTLTEVGRRNEIRLAKVRVAATAMGNGLAWVCWFHPPLGFPYPHFSTFVLVQSTAVLAVSLAFRWALRLGWYTPALSYLAAVLDGGAIAAVYLAIRTAVDVETVRLVFASPLAAICVVYAASGGLRASPGAAIWTGSLALLTYLVLAPMLAIPAAVIVTLVIYILAGAFLGYWMSGLTGSAVAGAVGRVTLERFLPRQVLDAALVDPLALLGPPRTIDATVLISDLRGFTALSETLPPAKLLAFLSVVQGELADAVRANGGVVDKFMGDGMLAVFGAPETDPEHARHALDAAKAALAAIVRLNAERAQLEQGPIRLGIGIHSGPVVVGCLGYGQRLEFTVIGSTVNTASRLESLTKEKAVEVLVSGETARRAPEAGLRAMGSVNVRGVAQPLDVFTLGG